MLLRPGSLSRPRTFSSQPLQTKLMTHNGLFRPIPYLTAVSADEPTASQQPPQAQLHRYNGLFRPSSCLPAFSPGPELSQVDLTRPSSCFFAASPGPAPASWPLQAQPLPPVCLYSPNICLTADSSGPASASLWTPQAKLPTFQQLLHTQLPPASGLFRPMGLIPHNSLSRPSFSLPVASLGREPPQVGLSRPTCTLRASSPGQAPLPGCVSRPDSCLSTTSLDSVPTHLLASLVGPQLPQAKLPRTRSGLTVPSPG
ncbi:putative uncharacterized protein FLJ44672 [Gorilla gorilla gorilla]|uniref:putative uncharacterized protein FLJ44672 n=1 Tax=Gorilla gorilla gorilla TaxID=9595 RepID=UPI00300B7D71